jgi:hypothetical protein
MLAAAALAMLALPAYAQADESLSATGSITYTWQGDPARGCAQAGLCGVRGEMIVAPLGDTSANTFRGTTDISIFSPTLTVRAAGPGGVCVDAPTGPLGSELIVTRRRHGGLAGRIEPPLSSSRCAGPTAQDLARVTFRVRRLGGRRPTYDVRERRGFAAGPFTGTVVSTLVLRPSTGGGGSSSSGSFSTAPTAPPGHRFLLEQVALRYRVASLPSALSATFSGEPDPFCAALASCGATGSLALSLPRFSHTFVLRATRVVRTRVSSRQALADLRHGMLSLGLGPPVSTGRGLQAEVSETFQGGEGSSCRAASRSRQVQLFVNPEVRRGGAHVVLSDPDLAGLMRTYCPGPSDSDLFGRSRAVATATLSREQLLRRRSVFALAASGSFAGLGYAGTRGGALQFSLTLEQVRAGTVQEAGP